MAIRLSQDLGLLKILSQGNKGNGQTTLELAQATGSDPKFLIRLLRLLASAKYLEEPSTGCFRGTEISQAFSGPGYVGGMDHLFTQVMPTYQCLPGYMAQTKYSNPEAAENAPFKLAHGTSEPLFDWFGSHPVEAQRFNDLMALAHDHNPLSWLDKYPASELVENVSLTANVPLIVDVGGGTGMAMENLRRELLPESYSLVVQDVDSVVQQAQQHRHKDVHESIEFQVHDFFTEQPVKGARAYLTHRVLHDWPDSLARQILQNIHPAMVPGYSKLLLCEYVLPEQSASPLGTSMDVLMMGLLCAKERTASDWKELLHSAGYRLVKIWGHGEDGPGVVEAEVI